MACSGGYCSGQCYSYGCAAANRTACAANDYDLGSLGTGPTVEMMNKMRAAIKSERDSRNNHSRFTVTDLDGVDVTTNDPVKATDLESLKTCINSMVSGGYDNTSTTLNDIYAPGALIQQSHFDNIRTKITELGHDCICNSDCGNNSVCSCYNDCGCNYSDERLKQDISYL